MSGFFSEHEQRKDECVYTKFVSLLYTHTTVNQLIGLSRTDARAAADDGSFPVSFAKQRVHFIGIGGSGMSGLANVLIDAGAIVSGSDSKDSGVTRRLAMRGAIITTLQDGSGIPAQTRLVVRTAAVKDDNAEFRAAVSRGLVVVKYAQLLGRVMADRLGIAVAGTHGKSTTTAMLALAMVKCGLEPSFVVGGEVPQLGGGSQSGRGPGFVVEACEYDRSFHSLRPTVAILNNIEADHLDCYGTLEAVIESFAHFAGLIPAHGLLIVRDDDANIAKAIQGAACPIETFGQSESATWRITDVRELPGNRIGATIVHNGAALLTLSPGVAGLHNVYNATAALAAAVHAGADAHHAADALAMFSGVDRRMTEMGHLANVDDAPLVVDDYGHHPTEVRVTLRALREKYKPSKLVCVFQPHQYSRTRLLLDEFAGAFVDADEVIASDIYAVRDSPQERAMCSAQELVRRINGFDSSSRARHIATFDEIDEFLKQQSLGGDLSKTLIVTMGAGNIHELAASLVRSATSPMQSARRLNAGKITAAPDAVQNTGLTRSGPNPNGTRSK